jgi:SHS2 domain-containing protein
VQLPGVQDTAKAKDILGRTATLEVRLVDDEASSNPAIMEQAARGMYALSGARRGTGPGSSRMVALPPGEPEGMLVVFLTELLFALESEVWMADTFAFSGSLEAGYTALLQGGGLSSRSKEIKAVTYHDLKITVANGRLEATVVFDV